MIQNKRTFFATPNKLALANSNDNRRHPQPKIWQRILQTFDWLPSDSAALSVAIRSDSSRSRWGFIGVLWPCWGPILWPCWGPGLWPCWGPALWPCWGPVLWPCWGPVLCPCWGPVLWPCWGPVFWPCCGPVFWPCGGPVFWSCWGPVFCSCCGVDFGLGCGGCFCCCPLALPTGDLSCWSWLLFAWLGWGEVMLGFGGGDWSVDWGAGVVGVRCCSSCSCCAGFCCCIGPFIVRAGPGLGGGMIGSDWFCCSFWGVPCIGGLLKLLFGPLRFWFWFWNGWFLKFGCPISPPRIGPPAPPPLRGWKLFIPRPPRLLLNRDIDPYISENVKYLNVTDLVRSNVSCHRLWVKLLKMATNRRVYESLSFSSSVRAAQLSSLVRCPAGGVTAGVGQNVSWNLLFISFRN